MNRLSFITKLLSHALKNPKSGKHLLAAKYQSWQDSQTHSIFDYDKKQSSLEEIIDKLFPTEHFAIDELKKNTLKLQDHVDTFFTRLKKENYPSKEKPYPIDYTLDNQSGLFLYLLCKIIKPDKVLETGVAYGLSSMYILQALSENKNGTLYSIDGVFTPWQSENMIGSAIPEDLRKRWNLIIGNSSEKLCDVLSTLNTIDIFLHDSLHTHKNMMYEFTTAWQHIKTNGFLISDDISGNNAFYEFYSRLGIEPFIMPQKKNSFLGIIRK